MPELPEVETIVRQLNRRLPGRVLVKTKVSAPKMVLPLSVTVFNKKLKGQKIKHLSRRGKVIVVELTDNNFLLFHLKMTGQLIFQPAQGQAIAGGHPQLMPSHNLPHKYTRAEFYFADGSALYFNDLRKFGWIKLVSQTEKDTLLSRHGLEPLAKQFTLTVFTELITKYPKRTIKQTLLDQTLVTGLGNIYADEACFLARILPSRIVNSLKTIEIKKLHQAIVAVLKLAVKHKGTSTRNYVTSDGTVGGFVPYLNVYGRTGQPCKRCSIPVKKIKLAGRGTHFCDRCQK